MEKKSFFKELRDKLYGHLGEQRWVTSDGRVFDNCKEAIKHAIDSTPKLRIKSVYESEL